MTNDVAEVQETVTHNLEQIRQRIALAEKAAGREAGSVRLLPVSKTFGAEHIRAAHAAGIRLLGENKVQEARRKHESFREELPDLAWAVIGHLQTNKARDLARFAAEFHGLHTTRVAETLQRRLELEDRTLDVFVQVNTSGEESKYGLEPAETVEFVSTLKQYDRLNLRGLMTLALFSDDMDRVRPCFVTLRELRDQSLEADERASELSMGMSADFEVAIQEGATTVRVGTSIFGERLLNEEHYWPGGNT